MIKKLHGRKVIVSIGGTVVLAAKSCVVTIDYDLIEITDPTSGKAKKYIKGRYTWTVALSGLVAADGFVNFLLQAGSKVQVQVGEAGETATILNERLSGEALIPTTSVDATVGQLAKGSLTLQGSGELLRSRPYSEFDVRTSASSTGSNYLPYNEEDWEGEFIFLYDQDGNYVYLGEMRAVEVEGEIMWTWDRTSPSPNALYFFNGIPYKWYQSLYRFDKA